MLNTSVGDIVIDLFVDECPIATKNFLQLCAIKYYNGCLIYNVQQNLLVQSGDPTGTGLGGTSIYGLLKGAQFASFGDELNTSRKLDKAGLVCMAHYGDRDNSNRSQFFITLRGTDLQYLEQRYTIFGEVAEGFETLEVLNTLYCDEEYRPFQDVRIKHTYVLDDPFPVDTAVVAMIPPSSPEWSIPTTEQVRSRIPYEDAQSVNELTTTKDMRTEAEIDLSIKRKEAQSRAIVLEMTGDLPDADVKPPDEVLFVCKLNPVTRDEDLELIFSRFGAIKSCEIIRDFKTGDSLNYAFIEFETEKAALTAYQKMNNVLIDDRRIKVDFSQSVSKLWNRFLLRPRIHGASPAPSIAAAQDTGRTSQDFSHDDKKGRSNSAMAKRSVLQVSTVNQNRSRHNENNGRASSSSSAVSEYRCGANSMDYNTNKGRLDHGDGHNSRNNYYSRNHNDCFHQSHTSNERGHSRDRSGSNRHRDRSRSRDRDYDYKRSGRHN